MPTTTHEGIPAPIAEAADRAFREDREFYVIQGNSGMTIVDEMPMMDHFQVSPSGAVHFAFWNEAIFDVELSSVKFEAAR